MEAEYSINNEGSFILEAKVGNGTKMCFDATRTIYSYGRLINHAGSKMANIKPHRPLYINNKWRIGFYAVHDIQAGEELLFDYGAGHLKESPAWMKAVRYQTLTSLLVIVFLFRERRTQWYARLTKKINSCNRFILAALHHSS